jgi:hypothetical protein
MNKEIILVLYRNISRQDTEYWRVIQYSVLFMYLFYLYIRRNVIY